ncbi:MAG: hypothetical protein AABY78_09385 [Nitrospirota bacterium]|jgi:hypothetical protein
MSNLAIQCIGSDCPPFWIKPSGEAFDENSSGKIVKDIDEAIKQLKKSITITFGRPLDEMRDSLLEIYKGYSRMDWDGYGAHAITEDAYEEAKKIIGSLPSSIPPPEIVAEPTGDIGFEWSRGKGQIFVISVSGRHRITYAGIFAGNKVHGSEYFEETLPLVIRQHLRRLYS